LDAYFEVKFQLECPPLAGSQSGLAALVGPSWAKFWGRASRSWGNGKISGWTRSGTVKFISRHSLKAFCCSEWALHFLSLCLGLAPLFPRSWTAGVWVGLNITINPNFLAFCPPPPPCSFLFPKIVARQNWGSFGVIFLFSTCTCHLPLHASLVDLSLDGPPGPKFKRLLTLQWPKEPFPWVSSLAFDQILGQLVIGQEIGLGRPVCNQGTNPCHRAPRM